MEVTPASRRLIGPVQWAVQQQSRLSPVLARTQYTAWPAGWARQSRQRDAGAQLFLPIKQRNVHVRPRSIGCASTRAHKGTVFRLSPIWARACKMSRTPAAGAEVDGVAAAAAAQQISICPLYKTGRRRSRAAAAPKNGGEPRRAGSITSTTDRLARSSYPSVGRPPACPISQHARGPSNESRGLWAFEAPSAGPPPNRRRPRRHSYMASRDS
jgi:hypothetical protein